MSDDGKIGKEAVVLAYIKAFLEVEMDITRETKLADLMPHPNDANVVDHQRALELQQALEEQYGRSYINPEASDGWNTVDDVIAEPVESTGT